MVRQHLTTQKQVLTIKYGFSAVGLSLQEQQLTDQQLEEIVGPQLDNVIPKGALTGNLLITTNRASIARRWILIEE